MAEHDTLPPDPFVPEKPLHRRMLHVRASKLQVVSAMLILGGVLVFIGVLLLLSFGWALLALGALLIAASMAAYRTLEDE